MDLNDIKRLYALSKVLFEHYHEFISEKHDLAYYLSSPQKDIWFEH